jgi:hypothetical protein
MKRILTLLFLVGLSTVFAQRDLTPSKRRKDVFGKSDYKDYRFYGLQFSAGATYQFTRLTANNPIYSAVASDGRPIDYTIDPAGKIGAFVELGMAHFPKKRSKISLALKTVLVSYYDWGLGFKLLGGSEQTTTNYYTPFGSLASTTNGTGDFYNGYVYGRFSVHKNINLSKRYFIDNGLGVNFDFRVKSGGKNYTGQSSFENPTVPQPLLAQLHYGLGFGIKLSRRSFFIPGVQIPILGIYEWRKGCAALNWYSSNYLPIQAQVKFIYLFEKKVKGCNTPGSEEDKKRNDEFLQNN